MQTLTLGPFAVHPDGILRPRAPALRPALRFAWRGRPCEAAMHGPEEGLRITAIAARVPSTAEHGAEHRRGSLAALADLPPSLPAGWRLALTPDHRVRLEAPAPLEPGRAPTAVALIAAMVRFCLALDPYLDRLEAALGAPGTENTWPG
jgi:hypothetical protein